MRFGGVPFGSIERQLAGAVRRGASFDQLLADSMIEVRHGDNRDVISPMHHCLLCMNTVISAGDATHALTRRTMSELFPDIGLRVFLGCSSLEGALRALSRLYASALSSVQIQLTTEPDAAVLSIQVDADEESEAVILEEIWLVWIFMHILRFLGRAPSVSAVTLRDPFHFNLASRHWGIGAPVTYGEVTAFRFPRRLLGEAPASPAGENVQWECHKLWLEFLRHTPPAAAVGDFVAGGGFVRFSDIARDAGVSPNTLRRQVQSPVGGFRQTRQTALVAAALGRLRDSGDSVESIAADLGYSDGRSLRRFLKTATGLTPQQVRTEGTAPAPEAERLARQKIRLLGEVLGS